MAILGEIHAKESRCGKMTPLRPERRLASGVARVQWTGNQNRLECSLGIWLEFRARNQGEAAK
jgi:hypothetical protein